MAKKSGKHHPRAYHTAQKDAVFLAQEEIKDILFDYEKQADQLKEMIKKYEVPKQAVRAGNGIWLCPLCSRRVYPEHSYCHWCGKMLRRK